MRTPLHLSIQDYSPKACEQRLELQMYMQSLNPQGFRTLAKRKCKQRPTRNEKLAKMAGMGGPVKPQAEKLAA